MNIQHDFGYTSEKLVADYLIKEGYSIEARNYKKKFGEIDLIARKGNVLAFVEVKARKNPLFDMSELISFSKQKKIVSVAKSYLAEHTIDSMQCRFDIALVDNGIQTPNLQYICDAFTEADSYSEFY